MDATEAPPTQAVRKFFDDRSDFLAIALRYLIKDINMCKGILDVGAADGVLLEKVLTRGTGNALPDFFTEYGNNVSAIENGNTKQLRERFEPYDKVRVSEMAWDVWRNQNFPRALHSQYATQERSRKTRQKLKGTYGLVLFSEFVQNTENFLDTSLDDACELTEPGGNFVVILPTAKSALHNVGRDFHAAAEAASRIPYWGCFPYSSEEFQMSAKVHGYRISKQVWVEVRLPSVVPAELAAIVAYTAGLKPEAVVADTITKAIPSAEYDVMLVMRDAQGAARREVPVISEMVPL